MATCWEMADLLALVGDVYSIFVTFPRELIIGIRQKIFTTALFLFNQYVCTCKSSTILLSIISVWTTFDLVFQETTTGIYLIRNPSAGQRLCVKYTLLQIHMIIHCVVTQTYDRVSMCINILKRAYIYHILLSALHTVLIWELFYHISNVKFL